MCLRIAHHSPHFFTLTLVISLVLCAGNFVVCTAQEQDDTTSCIVLAKPGQLYDLELEQLGNGTRYTITFSFDYEDEVSNRLMVQEPFSGHYDSSSDTYGINNDLASLCTIKYAGLETVLLGEERARLEVFSTDFHARLVGVHVEPISETYEIPKSFGIILALCSLVPFFLLIPDALTDLQAHLEVDAASKGVYGRILALLLPLLSIGLTFWLLEGLNLFGG